MFRGTIIAFAAAAFVGLGAVALSSSSALAYRGDYERYCYYHRYDPAVGDICTPMNITTKITGVTATMTATTIMITTIIMTMVATTITTMITADRS